MSLNKRLIIKLFRVMNINLSVKRQERFRQARQQLNRLLSSRFVFIASLVVFRVALDILYYSFVSPEYSYSGFLWSPEPVKYVESWLLYCVFMVILSHKLRRPSDCFILMMFVGVLAPLLSFYGLANQDRFHLYLVLFGYLLIVLFSRGRPIRLPMIRGGRVLALTTSFLLTALVLFWLIYSGGLSCFNLDVSKVYEYRRVVGPQTNIGVFAYLNIWVFKVFNPILFAWALYKRRYGLAVGVLLLQVVFFGISSHKSVLFYPIVILFVYYYFSWTRALSIVPLGIVAVFLISGICWFAIDWIMPVSMFVRRVFFVVAKNTFDYYTFFSTHELVFWSSSFLSSVIEYPYHINPARLIGEWQGTEASVNNTFLSTGYMHAGSYGIVLYGVLAGLLFRFIDSLAGKGLPQWLVLAVCITPIFSLISSADFPTALLTHGIGVAVLMLFLIRSNRGVAEPQSKR